MPTVAEYQQKYDEISAIRQAAKSDFSMSNAKKQEKRLLQVMERDDSKEQVNYIKELRGESSDDFLAVSRYTVINSYILYYNLAIFD